MQQVPLPGYPPVSNMLGPSQDGLLQQLAQLQAQQQQQQQQARMTGINTYPLNTSGQTIPYNALSSASGFPNAGPNAGQINGLSHVPFQPSSNAPPHPPSQYGSQTFSPLSGNPPPNAQPGGMPPAVLALLNQSAGRLPQSQSPFPQQQQQQQSQSGQNGPPKDQVQSILAMLASALH